MILEENESHETDTSEKVMEASRMNMFKYELFS